RFEDRLQQIPNVESPGDARQIRSNRRAVVVEAMTGCAADLTEELAATFKVPSALQPSLDDWHAFIDGPFLDDLPAGHQLLRPLPFRFGFQDRRSEEHTSELQSPYDLVCR